MAKFDVYPDPEGHYWLDCQADTFSTLNSRFVVPLQAAHEVDCSDRKLNPKFVVLGETYVMMTHFAGAVPTSEIRGAVSSLVEQEYEIGAALDLLIGGY